MTVPLKPPAENGPLTFQDAQVVRSKSRRGDILFTVGVILVLYTAWHVRDVLVLIYVSALFAVVPSPGCTSAIGVLAAAWRFSFSSWSWEER